MKNNFDKQINQLLMIDRTNFNRADRQIEKVVRVIYERGRRSGKKEMYNAINAKIKSIK